MQVGTARLDEPFEQRVDVQALFEVVVDVADRRTERRRVGMRRAVDALDRLRQLVATRGRRDDLVAGHGTHRRDRVVVAGFGERDDELGALEVDADGEALTRDVGRDRWSPRRG